MPHTAPTEHPVHELIAARWSPYGFSDVAVVVDDLRSLLEAARWAASSYNEQPWRFLVATGEQPAEFERMLACLVEGNRAWAAKAPVLMLGVVSRTFAKNGKPNRHALHDLGLAVGNLCFEATARGLCVHQMAGILPEKARETYGIPDGYEVATGIAVGYSAPADILSGDLKQRDSERRPRNPLSEFVFSAAWGKTADFLR